MLSFKNNPIFSKKPYYDEDSSTCVLLSKKAIFSPLGRIDRKAFVLLILIDVLMFLAGLCIVTIWDNLTGLKTTRNTLYTLYGIVAIMYFFVGVYWMFILVSKRMHDIGKSMWWASLYVVALFIVLLSPMLFYTTLFIYIVMITLAFFPGEKKENVYGPRVTTIQLFSDNIAEKFFNENFGFDCSSTEVNATDKVDFIENTIINSKIYCAVKNNIKKIGLSLSVLVLVGCTGYYLYIPKMSDVERYKANNDVVAMCNLVDKAISFEKEDHKYKDVRNQAIRKLAEMNTSEGNKHLENYLYSDDSKIDSDLKKEIFKALLVKHENFLNEFVDARLQKSSKEKSVLYNELLYVTCDENFKNNDFVERKIAIDIVNNMTNSIMDKQYVEIIKKFDCAKPDSGKDEFKYLLFSYINVSDELDDFDNKKNQEIDKQIENIMQERKQIAWYLQNVDKISGNMIREVYITKGVNRALEYTNQIAKNTTDQVNRYWQLESELEKLNYEKKNLGNVKYNLQNKQQLYYQKLKEYVNNGTTTTNIKESADNGNQANSSNDENMSNDLLGLNWHNGFIYMQKLKFEVKSDGGFLVYSDKNASIIKFRLDDCLPNSIHISSSRFVLDKKGDNIRSVQLECSGGDWNAAYKYLRNKYGSEDPKFSEASKSRYRAAWIRNERVIVLNYEKRDSKLEVECFDKKYFY